MKTFRFFALVGVFLLCVTNKPTAAARPDQPVFGEFQNYVVIGAFKFHRNATRFVNHAHHDFNLDAQLELNPSRQLYYVYVLGTNDRVQAISEARRLRVESEFTDTWVYSGMLGKNISSLLDGHTSHAGMDINPMTANGMSSIAASDDILSERQSPEAALTTSPQVEVEQKERAALQSPLIVQNNETSQSSLDDGKEGKRFMFKLFRAVDNASVEGDVNVIDIDRSRKMASYKGNAVVKVSDPASKSDNMSLVCEVFGYRKVQRNVNYNIPEGDGITNSDEGAVVVPFELVRLQRGDIAVMYNVYFFKDAAVMRPESRYEVNSLLEMLNENQKYKIKIHGHTNGNAAGKIVSLNKDSKNFFSLNETRESFGSAKQLSEERAELIRDYLVSNGIDPARMQIKAWGGKRAIQDKHSTRAQENVRVEIEILEN